MAEFVERTGHIFHSTCDVVTVTVNCEGVMGAGIALTAKLRWPAMFERYERLCADGKLTPGKLWLWHDPSAEPRHRVLCFPTKDRWRAPSRLDYIESGLAKLASTYREHEISTIAMPHLGCSHGGLEWGTVQPLIHEALGSCDDLTVELWAFDPDAADPDFDRLRSALGGLDARETAGLLGIRSNQAATLLEAVTEGSGRSLVSLQSVRGVGERTLQAVYDHLFRPATDGGEQQELF